MPFMVIAFEFVDWLISTVWSVGILYPGIWHGKMLSPYELVLQGNWSDLERIRTKPDIELERLHAYRTTRLKQELRSHDAALCVMVSPISLRYAIN